MSKIEVTKVEEKKIPASEFEIPAGYTKREPGMAHPPGMMGGMNGGHTGGASGGSSSAGNLGGGATAGDAPLTVAPPPANP